MKYHRLSNTYFATNLILNMQWNKDFDGEWVLQNKAGTVIDSNDSRHELAINNNLILGK